MELQGKPHYPRGNEDTDDVSLEYADEIAMDDFEKEGFDVAPGRRRSRKLKDNIGDYVTVMNKRVYQNGPIEELQEACRMHELPTYGTKADLFLRMADHLENLEGDAEKFAAKEERALMQRKAAARSKP